MPIDPRAFHLRLLVQDGAVIEPDTPDGAWRVKLPNGRLIETTAADLEAYGYDTRTGVRRTELPEGPERQDPVRID